MPHPFLVDRKRAKLYFVAYWVEWAVLQVGLLSYYGFSGSAYVWDAVISYTLLALICLVVLNVFVFYQPQQERELYWYFLAGLAALVWGFADKWILQTFIYSPDQQHFLERSMPVRFFVGFFNVIWLMTAAYFREKGGTDLKQEERKSTMQRSVKDAELYKLRQQLHPHFLFNSLNSINALIRNKPEQARQMVQQLSAFLRGTLKQEEHQFISLKEEIAYLKLYLDIEKVRFGHRLHTVFDTTDEALASMMPPLMLQPLMENAIKYGLYGVTGTVTIQLKARLIDPYLVVVLRNPYDVDQPMQDGTGFGLKSIQRRLYLLFGRDDLMEINQDAAEFEAIFRIPQQNQTSTVPAAEKQKPA